MAKKKPPQPPQDPIDDFDPDEIAPLDDDVVEEVVADDEIVEEVAEEVAADEVVAEEFVEADEFIDVDASPGDEPATQIVSSKAKEELPDVEVDTGDVKTRLDKDPELDATTELDGDIIEEAEPEEVLEEPTVVDGDDMLLSEDEATEVVADDEVLEPSSADIVDDSELLTENDAHDAVTAASVPALDEDPFDAGEGLGEGLLGDAPVDEFGGMVDGTAEPDEGELVGVGAEQPDTPYEEEEIPKPATHWLNYTLIGLNLVAVLAVPYFIVLDFAKRQEFTHAVFQTHFLMLGLPSEEEATKATAARATLPSRYLSEDTLKALFGARPGVVGVSDKFISGDEVFNEKITPAMLEDDELVKAHFKAFEAPAESHDGKIVRTIEDEIRRLKKRVVSDIKEAAKDGALLSATDDARRQRINQLLLPLAMNTTVVDALAARVKNAKGDDLKNLLVEAFERRMAFDLLLPIELFRPGDHKGLFLERFANVPGLTYPKQIDAPKFANLTPLPIDEVMKRIEQRIDSTIGEKYEPIIMFDEKEFPAADRGSIEKRMTVAFTLLCLAHLKKPHNGEAIFPDLMKRVPGVVGLYDYSVACELFPGRLIALNERVLDRIRIDREGAVVPGADATSLVRTKAFIDYYEEELQRIRFIQQDIFKANIRLTILEDQKARYEVLLKERIEQRADVLKRIEVARAKTASDAASLRIFQEELHRYQKELATAEDDLERIHAQIQSTLGRKVAPK